MKLKLSPFHLLSIILIQIILIDLVLFVFLFGALNKGKSKDISAANVKNTSVKVEDKNTNSNNVEINQASKTQSNNVEVLTEKTAETQKGNLTEKPTGEQPESKAAVNAVQSKQNKSGNAEDTSKEKSADEKTANNDNYLFNSAFTGSSAIKYDILKNLIIRSETRREIYRDIKMSDDTPEDMVVEGEFIATAYDLSYESCGKYPWHPQYGITFSGKKAVKGRTVAVDPKVIPLGSKVYLEFSKPYIHLTGWYVAEDTGKKVKGNIIDVFFGESAFIEMEKFGSRKVKAKIIHPKESMFSSK